MELILIGLLSLLLGAGGAYFLGLRAKRAEFSRLEDSLREAQTSLAGAQAEAKALRGQLEQLGQDRETMKQSFMAIAAEGLKTNREEFFKQATERFQRSEEHHSNELTKRHEDIEKQFKGLNETFEKFRDLQQRSEKERGEDFGSLRSQLLTLGKQTEALGQSTTGLSTALKGSSQSRGKWGEMALRNIVEAAGMTEHADFTEQKSDDSGSRPDLLVKLPGGALIPIDAKVPYADYDRMIEEKNPELRTTHLKRLGDTMRSTMLGLAKRDYPEKVDGKIDFTVMFIPIESVAAAAFEARPDLQTEGMENKVLITTPVTLIALLRTVGLYWRQEKMAQNARLIWDEANELHKRVRIFQNHLGKVAGGLETAVNHFNSAVGSYESRVLSQGRRIEELSALKGSDALPNPEYVESPIRPIRAVRNDDEDQGD